MNTECLSSLVDTTNDRPLDITPCQLHSAVEVTQDDVVYVIQHPKGQPRSVSSYTINYVLGMCVRLCVCPSVCAQGVCVHGCVCVCVC